MKVRFDEAAWQELRAAAQYYEDKEPGLGSKLTEQADQAVGRLVRMPSIGTLVESGARRVRLQQFPYGVVFLVEGGEIYVAAFMHLRRKPGYWVTRLKNKGSK